MTTRPLALAAICAANALWILDLSTITVSLPSIEREVSGFDPAWLPVGFAATFGGALPLGGWLADRYSRRAIIGLAGVLVALTSLLLSTATSAPLLIAARVGTGVAAALLVPASYASIKALYSDRRVAVLSLCGVVQAGAFVSGSLLGGILTGLTGWRLAVGVVLVSASLCTGALALALPTGHADSAVRLSLGPIACGLVVGLWLLAIQRSGVTWLVGAAALVPLFLGGLLTIGRRVPRVGSLTDWRGMVAPNIAGIYLVAAGDVVLVLVTIHLQSGLGRGPAYVGAVFAVFGAGALLGGRLADPLISRIGGTRGLAVSLMAQAGAIAALASDLDNQILLVGAVAAFGLGNWTALVAIGDLVVSASTVDRVGSAGALLQICQQWGAATGVAAFAVITRTGSDHLRLALILAALATLLGLVFLPLHRRTRSLKNT